MKSSESNYLFKAKVFASSNIRLSSFVVVDFMNNFCLHFLDTIKVRMQAKSMINDTSLYNINKVTNKGLIAGVTSSAFGSVISSTVFILLNNALLKQEFKNYEVNFRILKQSSNPTEANKKRLSNYNKGFDWKYALLKSYLIADIAKTIVFMPFEARKQRIQMGHSSEYLYNSEFFRNMFKALPLYIIRDCASRLISMYFFLNFLDTSYCPRLKYSIEEIQYLLKKGYIDNNSNGLSECLDYSNFIIDSPYDKKFSVLIFACLASTIITHPLDVISTKFLTQTDRTYTSVINSCKLIYKSEGISKILYSGFVPRLYFNLLSALNVFVFYNLFYDMLINYKL
jgi:hypothetical protein